MLKKTAITLLAVLTLGSSIAFASESTEYVKVNSESANDVLTSIEKNAESMEIRQFVENYVKEAYDSYYTINSIHSNITNLDIASNTLVANVDISLTKTLRAPSVKQLPYVQGMTQQMETFKQSRSVNPAMVEVSSSILDEKISELQEYIGASTDQNDSFRLTAEIINGEVNYDNSTLEFQNYIDYIPAEYFKPQTEEQLNTEGKQELVSEARVLLNTTPELKSALAAVSYNRIAARDYANTYTSEVSGGGYNTSYWNKKYAFHTESGGVDCANYVSQSIYAGGVPTDSEWKPESTAWVNTGYSISNGLRQYMLKKGYFKVATKSTTAAGGFIAMSGYSHVLFVVANDTVTMQYSAHTNDRLKASFASFDSTNTFYAPAI
ncbi:amidase domain-containing protein [Paenibacillus monticola]|uniref:Putative amidase domain-containing protein n=1 Tax=Paenibacillus monticola TaxID=2666075 RepID=A0A7X2L4L3_9BACL|nr:amidase domain-containing protein [Paenibacillus monticola]MRN56604.1 hypothetical protein [Paenibacillus monticola]